MAKYIGREAITEYLMGRIKNYLEMGDRLAIIPLNFAMAHIKSLPAADVAPVRHGRWIIGVDDDDFDVKCSKCEWTDIFEVAGIAAVERIAKTMHYCLNCGAKMDLEGETNDD